jgi:GNAT superfamily N-acetyltransferase
MSPRILPAPAVSRLDERWAAEAERVWPEYNHHGDVLNQFWGRLDELFPNLQFVLVGDGDDLLARGFTIPCSWNGTAAGLPDGIDGVIRAGVELAERGEQGDTLSALAIAVAPRHRRGGWSRVLIEHMRSLAAEHGFRALIAPLRPTWKERYPLASIERYANWKRADGLPFDPWIRQHVRLGAEILRSEPRSLRVTGTIAEWEEWTGMAFPETGDYVFPHGLATLAVDVEADLGRYWEPNVWVRHAV